MALMRFMLAKNCLIHGNCTSSLKSVRTIILLLASCHAFNSACRLLKIALRGHSVCPNFARPWLCCWYVKSGPSKGHGRYTATTLVIWFLFPWSLIQPHQPIPVGLLPAFCAWWASWLKTATHVPLVVPWMDVFPTDYILNSTELPPTIWLVEATIGDTPLGPSTCLIQCNQGCPLVGESPIDAGGLTSYHRLQGPYINLRCFGRQSVLSSPSLFLAYYPSNLDSCGCLPPHPR